MSTRTRYVTATLVNWYPTLSYYLLTHLPYLSHDPGRSRRWYHGGGERGISPELVTQLDGLNTA